MAIPTRTIRGLQDIRSHSGRPREALIPYKAFMRLSCLEMEKFRRGKEKESAMVRVRNIEARFRDIETEKKAILKAMGKQGSLDPADAPRAEPVAEPGRKNTGGFRIRY